MTKAKSAIVAMTIATPRVIAIGTTSDADIANLRVVDEATGETITRVVFADADAGRVERFKVEDGNLVRENDHFAMIEEERSIRIEWIDPPAADVGSADLAVAKQGDA